MTLFDSLKLISSDLFPPMLEKSEFSSWIDTRPQTVYKVTICFMREKETWITCNIQNEILVPWYDCEVRAIKPGIDNTLQIWLKDVDYLQKHWPQHLWIEEQEDGNDGR